VPVGTGWFTQKEKSGGGAIIDVGLAMLDLAWFLLGQPNPQSAFGITHSQAGQHGSRRRRLRDRAI
jgi:predicted dehydrogenase